MPEMIICLRLATYGNYKPQYHFITHLCGTASLFFGYFILAKQKKVACCRATPGGVNFDVGLLDSRVRGNDARYAFPIPLVGNPICFANANMRSIGNTARGMIAGSTYISLRPVSKTSARLNRPFIAIHGQWLQLVQFAPAPAVGASRKSLSGHSVRILCRIPLLTCANCPRSPNIVPLVMGRFYPQRHLDVLAFAEPPAPIANHLSSVFW